MSAASEDHSPMDSSVKSVAILSGSAEEGDFSTISMPEVASKSGAGDSSASELSPVFSPGFEEKAPRDLGDRFTPVELRATPERGRVVADLSIRDGGLMYSSDPPFKTGSLDSPIPATVSEENTLPSFDDITPEELRLTSTPICGRIVGDLGSGRGHLYSDDLDPKTSVSADPCSPVPFPPSKDGH